jgi:hypothetical protein
MTMILYGGRVYEGKSYDDVVEKVQREEDAELWRKAHPAQYAGILERKARRIETGETHKSPLMTQAIRDHMAANIRRVIAAL